MAPPPPPRKGATASFTLADDDEQDASFAASSSSSSQSALPGSKQPSDPPTKRDFHLRLPHFTTISSSKRAGGQNGDDANRSDVADSDTDEEDGQAFFHASNSTPQTPNISEAAQQLRRSLSVHGLHQLSSMPPQELRRSVGSKVWRPHDEQAKLPGDWDRLAVHVFRGGSRAFNLAFGLRATLMLVLALVKGLRKRKWKAKDLREAIFSIPNLRFALMFGIWAGLYKSVHNSLRLLTPIPPAKAHSKRPHRSHSTPERRNSAMNAAALDMSRGPSEDTSPEEEGSNAAPTGTNTPRSGYQQVQAAESEAERAKLKSQQKRKAFMRDPRSKVWHAYIAGAVSALALLVETKENRISLAQQLFVRGAEGSYNVAHAKGLVRIPHGAVLAFGLACGQIMYAWLNAPETLPKGYVNWITNASMVTPKATTVHRDVASGRPVDVDFVMKNWFPQGELPATRGTSSSTGLVKYGPTRAFSGNRRGMTAHNTTALVDWLNRLRNSPSGVDPSTHYVPCHLVHPWEDSHFWSPIDRFVEVTRWILPVYLTLHFVPALFLRTGSFLKDPMRVLLRSIFGSLRSSSFLGVFVIIFQTIFCAAHSLHDRILSSPALKASTPQWFLDFLAGGGLHWLAGFLTSGSLFVDHARRRAELAAYVLPKGMESAWSVARKRGWAPFVPGGDLLLTSLGMSMVMGTYARSPEHLSGLVRRIVYQFIGRN
ncbi:unnamed protein product [Jaminaea pallidilutea]